MTVAGLELKERFFLYVEQGEACWTWIGATDRYGRGRFRNPGGTCVAPRLAWEFENGPVPEGLRVLHSCDNPNCVNPDHLWIGTQRDNLDDMRKKNRHHHPPVMFGESNPFSKLTKDNVIEIRASTNKTNVELGARFNVHPNTISYVRSGKTWGHV